MKKLFTFLIIVASSFVLHAQESDFGDAPDGSNWWGGTANFPTLDASVGPKHTLGDQSTFWIGDQNTGGTNTTTMELDANTTDADVDDGKPRIFIMLIGIPAAANITVPIRTNASHDPNLDIYINVAIDVDNDNDFDDSPDMNWIVQNKIVKMPADTSFGFNFGPFGFGNDLLLLPVWVRITVTTVPISGQWDGKGIQDGWEYGETEDWWFTADGSRGYNGRKMKNPPSVGSPPIKPQPNPKPQKCVELIHPRKVYLKCEETKCFYIGVKDCGDEEATDISLEFSFDKGYAPLSPPAVDGVGTKVGKITWFKVCATGWDCDDLTEMRWARYKINVKYDPDGLYVEKEFYIEIGNDELSSGIDEDDQWRQWLNAEPLDTTGFIPWYGEFATQMSHRLAVWQGQFEGQDWLTNGQPILTPVSVPSWATFSETSRDGNTSATYTFSGTPGITDNGLDYLELTVESSDPTDGYEPWLWRIPIYITYPNNIPSLNDFFQTSYSININDNESIQQSFEAEDRDHEVGIDRRDTMFYDWYLWDTESLKYHDEVSVTFTDNGDFTSDFLWIPDEDDVGNYSLVMQCFDYYEGFDSSASSVKIFNLAIDFEGEYLTGFAPHSVSFTDLSTAENTSIASREWLFGDGKQSTVENPVHTYDEPGTYSLRLKVTDSDGYQTDNREIDYIVVNDVGFGVDTTQGEEPLTATFENLSGTELDASLTSSTMTSASFSWRWDFGDGTSSSEFSPQHEYKESGNYTVSMTGYMFIYDYSSTLTQPSASFTSETIVKENYITVLGELVADFEADPLSGDVPLDVQFTDKSTGPPTAWLWSFGDGSETSEEQNPLHKYTTTGNYSVQLTVYRDEQESTKTETLFIQVTEPLKANFDTDTTNGEAPLTVNFTNKSTGDPAPTAFSWDFGDGSNNGVEENEVHVYEEPGTYSVTLIASTVEKSDTLIKTDLIVVTAPSSDLAAEFSAEPLQGDEPLTVQFSDSSTGSPTTWEWSFGDGGESLNQNPSWTYENSGTFTVSLTVSDGEFVDTETKENFITVGVTGVYDFMANSFELEQNYPNPFKQTTTIQYSLRENCTVSLKLYNSLGIEIITFVDGERKSEGTYSIDWDGKNINRNSVPSGVYYYELTIEGSEYRFSKTKELVIIR